jgi:hypothetical protein
MWASGDEAKGFGRHSGMVRKHQTRNLEIPGLVLSAKLNINFVASDHPGMTKELHSERTT